MAKETERKFLVREEILTPLLATGGFEKKRLSQYYLVASKEAAVRLRLETTGGAKADTKVVLTVKAGGDGLTTNEFEFGIENGLRHYFEEMPNRQGIEIRKTRYLVPHAGRTFEVDIFHGELAGLVVAELEAEDAEAVVDLPEWIAEEVTYDSRYKNAVLALEGRPAGLDERVAASPEVFLELRALENPCVRIAGRGRAEWAPPAIANPERSAALDELAQLDADLLDLPPVPYGIRATHPVVDALDALDAEEAVDHSETIEFFRTLLSGDDLEPTNETDSRKGN